MCTSKHQDSRGISFTAVHGSTNTPNDNRQHAQLQKQCRSNNSPLETCHDDSLGGHTAGHHSTAFSLRIASAFFLRRRAMNCASQNTATPSMKPVEIHVRM